jgi:hypothetical protein
MSDIGRLMQQPRRPHEIPPGNAKLRKNDRIVRLRQDFTTGALTFPSSEYCLRTEQGCLQQGVRARAIRSHCGSQDGNSFGRFAGSYERVGETPARKDVLGAFAEELLVL